MKTDYPLNTRPQCAQVEKALTALMETLKPGDQLPSEPDLARQFGVSRATLREVLRVFSERGLLRRRQGTGTFLTARIPTLDTGLEVLESLEQTANRLGLNAEVKHLTVVERDATQDERAGLGRSPDETVRVLAVDRVMTVSGQPVAYLSDVVPVKYLKPDDLGDGFRGSVQDILLQRADLLLSTSRTDITIQGAPALIAALLGIQRGAMLLKFTAQLYTGDEQIVDYSIGHFVPGHFKFHVIRKVKVASQ